MNRERKPIAPVAVHLAAEFAIFEGGGERKSGRLHTACKSQFWPERQNECGATNEQGGFQREEGE